MAFKIAITIYNGEKWIAKCVKSLLEQSYDNWEAIVVDDCSTDGTFGCMQSFAHDPRISILSNKERKYKAYNQVNAYKKLYQDDEDILCTIDGDDFLTRKDALQLVHDFYAEQKCWATYGSMVKWPSLWECPQLVYSESQGVARTIPWMFDQLRTYKAFLWKEIKDCDFRDSNGEYFTAASDTSIFRPVLEMCTSKRALRFPEYIYAWNVENPINDGVVHRENQSCAGKEIQKKKPYKEIKV